MVVKMVDLTSVYNSAPITWWVSALGLLSSTRMISSTSSAGDLQGSQNANQNSRSLLLDQRSIDLSDKVKDKVTFFFLCTTEVDCVDRLF